MSIDQLKRFSRWQQRLPAITTHLTGLVLDEIVPAFRERGFERFPDYAGGNSYAVGPNCIPLQRRDGVEWPTAEILFDRRGRPTLGVNFAQLPEVCCRQTIQGPLVISRLEANVVEGPAFFMLCKGGSANFDCNFGCHGLALRPKARIEREIAILKSLLPRLFSVLEEGIPQSWYMQKSGYVAPFAFLSPASRYLLQRPE